MAAEINPQVIITAKDEASRVLQRFGDEAEKTGRSFKDLAQGALIPLAAASVALTGAIISSIGAFQESQNTIAQLDAVLKSTKGVIGMTREELIKMSSALQQTSTFSDEAILSGENLLLTFTNIGKNIFPEATQTILDMSQALGQDMKSSAIQLGKALQDPILGVTALRRVGVNFNEAQTDIIKGLVESGNLLAAQKMILKELATEFGGSALAASKTFSGQMVILKNNVNDLQEMLGRELVQSLMQLVGGMGNINEKVLQFNAFLVEHEDIVKAAAIALLVMAGATVIAAAAIGIMLAPIILVVGAIVGLVGAVAFAAAMIVMHWSEIQAKTQEIWNNVIQVVTGAVEGIRDTISSTFTNIVNLIKEALNAIGQGFITIMLFILAVVDLLTGGMVGRFLDWAIKAKAAFQETFNFISQLISSFTAQALVKFQSWGEMASSAIRAELDKVTSHFNRLKDQVSGILDGLGNKIREFLNWIGGLISGFRPSIDIGINLPDLEGKMRELREKAKRLGIPGFQTGGIVSGPIGTPQLAVVHGGEEVVPFRGARGGNAGGGMVNFNVYVGLYAGSAIEKRRIAEELYRSLLTVAGSQNKSVADFFGG